MPLRTFSFRAAGGKERPDECRDQLRAVAKGLGAIYVKIDRTAEDVLVNAVFDLPDEERRRFIGELTRAARSALPSLRGEIAVDEHPSRPHELTAQILLDRREGTLPLHGALQAPEDIAGWERFLATAQPRGVLELGTSAGVFAHWLSKRVDWFRTIDVATPERATPGFVQVDVWAEPERVHDLIRKAPRPFVLYCDDGNKQLEVEKFGRSLWPGDYLAVHDVGTEFFPEGMPAGYDEQFVQGLTGFYRKASSARPSASP